MGNETNKPIQISRTALDSLLFFTFGATLDEGDGMLRAIINKAIFDATNQGAFNTHIEATERDAATKTKSEVAKKLFEILQNYQGFSDPKHFNTWHDEVCEQIKELYKNDFEADFTYGNAQKTVNMTFKYLYLLSEISNYSEMDSNLQRIITAVKNDSEYIHVPVDSYIIDAIWKNSDAEERRILPSSGKINYGNNNYARPSDYIIGWSKWGKCYYLKAQNLLEKILKKTGKSPLDWESDAWIRIAKDRRDRKIKNLEKNKSHNGKSS